MPGDLSEQLNDVKNNIHDPELERLKHVDKLVDPQGNEVLSDLSEPEITTIALFRALNSHLTSSSDPGEHMGIPSVMLFFDEIIKLRASKNRLSRAEIVTILKARQTVYNYGQNSYDEKEQSSGSFWDKIAFWKNRGR